MSKFGFPHIIKNIEYLLCEYEKMQQVLQSNPILKNYDDQQNFAGEQIANIRFHISMFLQENPQNSPEGEFCREFEKLCTHKTGGYFKRDINKEEIISMLKTALTTKTLPLYGTNLSRRCGQMHNILQELQNINSELMIIIKNHPELETIKKFLVLIVKLSGICNEYIDCNNIMQFLESLCHTPLCCATTFPDDFHRHDKTEHFANCKNCQDCSICDGYINYTAPKWWHYGPGHRHAHTMRYLLQSIKFGPDYLGGVGCGIHDFDDAENKFKLFSKKQTNIIEHLFMWLTPNNRKDLLEPPSFEEMWDREFETDLRLKLCAGIPVRIPKRMQVCELKGEGKRLCSREFETCAVKDAMGDESETCAVKDAMGDE